MDENTLLQGFGLTDSQITQVMTIQKATRETVRADFTHIRLVQAQIAEALLPSASGPDQGTINALIDKKGQYRIDIEKNVMAARLQLLKIMGDDNFAKYSHFVMARMHRRFHGQWQFMDRGDGPRPMQQDSQGGPEAQS